VKPQLCIDLDGVLGDFYGFYEQQFGVLPDPEHEPPELWDNIRAHGSFYRNQPLMSDAMELWNGCKRWDPIILSGIPHSIPNVAEQKRAWVDEHFGNVKLICCRSRDKFIYGKSGDILVDDRLKYSKYWLGMGGRFVHHQSAKRSLALLAGLFSAGASGRKGLIGSP